MTWTYDPANVGTDNKDQLRLLVGDTDTTDQQMQDEELTWYATMFPAQSGKPLYLAAAAVCDALAMKYAREMDNSVGPLSESASQQHQHYLTLGQTLRTMYATGGKGVIPGSLAATPIGMPVLGGGGPTYLGPSAYMNPRETA